MSVAPVAPAVLALLPGASLAARLSLGQAVRAQVLHHFEGGRYLVRILGHDSVVDSASPLRPGEALQLRVARLQDRVELERVAAHPAAADEAPDADAARPGADLVEELFRRYRARLESAEAEIVRRRAARSPYPERVPIAALVLRKLELPIDADLLEATCASMHLYDGAPVLDQPAAPALAAALAPKESAAPGLRVLNTQGGGAVAHQAGGVVLDTPAGTIAVEIAVFEESDGEPGTGSEPRLRHRKLVVALDAPHLGRLEARAVSADRHLRVALATASSQSTHALLRHSEALALALHGGGWQVDEIAHETRAQAGPGAALGAVLEHLVTPGSVSRFA